MYQFNSNNYKIEFLCEVMSMKGLITAIIVSILITPVSIITIGGIISPDLDESKMICEPVDEVAPVSALHATPSIYILPENIYYLPTVTLIWNGTDNLDGSGINHFDVQYKAKYVGRNFHTMEIPTWRDLEMDTTNTTYDFWATPDYIYYFRCRAVDNAGNEEPWPMVCDSFSVVVDFPTGLCDEIYERLENRVEERIEKSKERIEDLKDIINPSNEDCIPPTSRVVPNFPIHLWIPPTCWPQDLDVVTIQVYPYPPSYYILDWLEEHGVVSEGYGRASFGVSWLGIDNPNGSGIRSYDVQWRQPHMDVYYRTEKYIVPNIPYIDHDWTNWLSNTTQNQSLFYASSAGLYQFRCRAYDNAENMERYLITADTSVFVIDLRCTDTY
jgi:hypothetical protein